MAGVFARKQEQRPAVQKRIEMVRKPGTVVSDVQPGEFSSPGLDPEIQQGDAIRVADRCKLLDQRSVSLSSIRLFLR